MRKLCILLLFLDLCVNIAAQQEAVPAAPYDGGVSEVLQSIYIPPLHNAPFSATLHTEWARPLAGGGATTLVNQRKIVRDTAGRIYQERWLLAPKDSGIKSAMNLVQIYDPNEHTGYDCFLLGKQKDHCELRSYSGIVRPETTAQAGPMGKAGFRTHEDLGTRFIAGIETTGTRDTITMNAGVIGNDTPIRIVREFWHSAQLGINLLSILSDPRIGTQTFTITSIEATEPDPRYFDLPPGFQIIDTRQPEEPQRTGSTN